jgi:phosphomannomutase
MALAKASPKISFLKIGLSSTPMFYYTVCTHHADGGIMITASHNPREWNGMKIVGKMGKPITGKEILSYINEEK